MVLRSHWLPDKLEVVAEQGMVVAKHPLAADAGIEVLADGATPSMPRSPPASP